MPHCVERYLLGQHRDERGPFGARADEAHLALQNVDELWQLVEARLAQESSDAGHPGIVHGRPFRSPILLGATGHAAKLEHRERLAPLADPLLPVHHRRACLERDQQRDDDHHGQHENEQRTRGEDVECTLDVTAHPALAETITVDEPAWLERCHRAGV